MCGICGYYNLSNKSIEKETIKAMCDVIKHRGPDDEGIYIDETFGMGMRRLSIIDLDTGHQPIHNEDESVWTVLNGEIYNYLELTENLKKKGHVFRSKSDTEVIVHLYEEYGYEFVKYLRGMFGLALWDKRKKELILARDPLGIKQLYFYKKDDNFIFGSEIKCILKVKPETLRVNYEALNHYLTFLYFPDNFTIYENIERLKQGHFLVINENGITYSEYWNLNRFQQLDMDFKGAQEEFLKLMSESMRLQLRSDVPLGIFLSGGIDSSIITALASQFVDKQLNTFTIGYNQEGKFYDERKYAKIISKLFNTNHQEYVVSPNIVDTIYKLIYSFDEPFANSSAIPNYYISKLMRNEVKVALSGLGGDEICAGYERILGMKLLTNFNKFPLFVKNIAKKIVNFLPDSKTGGYFIDRSKRFMRTTNLAPEKAYFSIIAALDEEKKNVLLSNENRSKYNSYAIFANIINNSNQSDTLRKISYFDLVSYMTGDLLVLTDRTSMANSLEVRVPFLDHKLVEFMFKLPTKYKIRGLQKKYLFKKAFKNILPKEILFRKKKGFSTPMSVWLRNDLRLFSSNIFTKERINATETLDSNGIQLMLKDHFNRKANHQGIIFALITFIIWHEEYIQKQTRRV